MPQPASPTALSFRINGVGLLVDEFRQPFFSFFVSVIHPVFHVNVVVVVVTNVRQKKT